MEPFSDSINIELVWVGPTRERIFESVTVPVATSSVQLSLSPLVTAAAPGVGGGLEVDVTSVGEQDDAVYDNIKVIKVGLWGVHILWMYMDYRWCLCAAIVCYY